MKTDTQCQEETTSPGLSLSEALAFNQGWIAAKRGDPFAVQNGQMWVSGYIQFHWLRDDGGRSWKRH